MKNRLILYVLLISSLSIFSSSLYATHLMGGSLNYEYLGLNAGTGNYEYEVTLTIYRLCDPGSALLDVSMNLGVYQDNPANPSGDKQLVLNTILPLISQQAIVPPNANDTCTFAPNVCVEQGIYQAIVAVSPNTSGYYFISDRCCRNNNIVNLNNPGAAGQAYFAYATDPTVSNSSPTFAAAPVPFICANDTVSILNQAFDPDGDLLVYNFVTPYNGVSNNFNPNPNPPINYPWTVPTVTYNPGYSTTNPFGAGGSATINTSTGLAAYYATNTGFYVLAVEIEEYRNGVLVGLSRRDLQIIVITCPVNPSPGLSSSTTQTSYTIIEGDSLCFNMTFDDSNGDSIYVSHIGDIFNSSITNPTATFIDASGSGTATGQFCWATDCSQGSNVPYQFTVTATDNGCPAKVTNIVYTITVENTATPGPMTGPDTLCISAATGIGYSVPLTAGYTYSWQVNNASINGPSNGSSIDVNFINPGPASISVIALNSNGCPSDTLTKQVYLSPQPSADAGTNITYCSGTSAQLGVASTPGYVYIWTPSTGLSTDTISDPLVTLINTGTVPISVTYTLTTNLDGCTNTDSVVVTSNPVPVPSGGPDVAICSGNSAVLGLPLDTGYVYQWTPATGLNNDTIAEPTVTLIDTTGTSSTLQYVVNVTNIYGCTSSDTVTVTLNPAPTAIAGNDTSVCSGTTITLGSSNVSGYGYSWTPATGLSNDTISDPSVTLINNGTQPDTVTYYLTTNLGVCQDIDTVMIIVKPNPAIIAGQDTSLCSGEVIILGGSSTPGYTYNWTPNTWLNNDTISAPTLTAINNGTTPVSVTYTLNVSLDGCQSTDSITVTVNPLPSVTASGSPLTVCSGDTVTLSGAGATGYSWATSTAPSTIISTDSTFIVLPLVTTTYILTGTNLFACSFSDTLTINVNQLPNLAITTANDTICEGDTITLTAGGASVYDWYENGVYIGTGTNIQVSPSATSVYVLNGTNLNNCSSQDSIVIHVNPAATVSGITGTVSVCPGINGVQYTITNPNPNSTYNWTITSGTLATGQGTATITVDWSATPGTGLVSVTEITADGCASNPVDLPVTINMLLTPVAPAGPTTLCANEAQGIIYNAFNTNGSTYTWFSNGGNVVAGNGTSTATFDFNVPGPQLVAVWYEETSTTAVDSCFGASDTLYIFINPIPVTSAITGPLGICVPDTGSFSVINTPTSTYAWNITGGTILSGNGTNAVTANWTGSGSAVISVVETDSLGCTGDTVSYTITINPLPAANAGPDVAVCTGQGVQLNASGGTVYSWTPATGLSATNIPDPVASPTTVTQYIVTVTDANGCINSDSVTVSVNALPVITTSADTSICLNDSIQISASGGSTYQWSPANSLSDPNVSSPVAGPINTTTYTVVVTDQNGCIDSSNVTITINPLPVTSAITGPGAVCENDTTTYTVVNTNGSTYSWTISGGNIVSGDGTNTVTAVYTAGGVAVISVLETNSFGCSGDSVSFNVTVNPLPAANAGPDVAVCTGNGTQLNASGGVAYQWSPGAGLNNPSIPDPVATPSSTTTYTVLVIDVNGCRNTDEVIVTVNPLPVVSITPNSNVCIGNSLQLNAGGGVSYMWSPATNLSSTTIPDPVTTPVSTIQYTVVVTDVNGCVNSDSVTVTVNSLPTAIAGGDTTICAGTTAFLSASGGVSYSWTPASSLNNSGISNPIASPTSITTYTVTVTDANGCSDDDQVTVDVNIQPEAAFTVDDSGLSSATCDGYDGYLINNSIDALNYVWQFPNGTTSTDVNPQVHINLSGSNLITLIAINNICADTTTVDFTSTAVSQIFDNMPNIFTPNGDGQNDCFDLGATIDIAECSVWQVFNRWGSIVFTSSSSRPCWNGKKDGTGEDLPAGTYFIIVKISGEEYKGSVTLIR